MVTGLTKAAVKDVRAEMKDYMTNKPPPPESSQANHAGHQATGHVAPNPPHGIPQQVHGHHPIYPYYPTTYTPAQHQAWIQTNYGLCTSSLQHNSNNTSIPKMTKTETRLQIKLSEAPAVNSKAPLMAPGKNESLKGN
eukprot:3850263-Ditylum_brightwellii.AAC.1